MTRQFIVGRTVHVCLQIQDTLDTVEYEHRDVPIG